MKYWKLTHNAKLNGLNLSFLCVYYMEEISMNMWNDLNEYVKGMNLKINGCIKTFEKTNIQNFYIPDQFIDLFDNIEKCDYMFEGSSIETINANFRSEKLETACSICANCSDLKHVKLAFSGNSKLLNINNGFARCMSLITSKLTFNSDSAKFIFTFDECHSLTSLLITFNRICYVDTGFNVVDCERLKWFRIHGEFKYVLLNSVGYSGCKSFLWDPTGLNCVYTNGFTCSELKYCFNSVSVNHPGVSRSIVHIIDYAHILLSYYYKYEPTAKYSPSLIV